MKRMKVQDQPLFRLPVQLWQLRLLFSVHIVIRAKTGNENQIGQYNLQIPTAGNGNIKRLLP